MRETKLWRPAVVAALLVLAVPLAAHAQATLEKIKSRGWVNVGYRVGAAPFSDQDAKGAAVGYSLDLCAPVVERLKVAAGVTEPVRYVAVATDQRFRLLTQGSIDILCDSTTDTAERRNTVDFSKPIFIDAVQVMVRTKDNIGSIAQLDGKTVVVIGSTTAPAVVAQYMAQKNASWQVARALNAEAAIGQLQLGWASGYARDGVLLASQRAAGSAAADYAILPDRLSSEPIALAFRKNDAGMRQLVDEVLTTSMKNGAMAAAYDKWFVKSVPPAKALGIPMSAELKAIIAGAR